jgi:pimeloyl-ACP methyl ester carboxylesterase
VTTPVRLQTNVWNPLAERRALLLHGLTSDGATWWRLGSQLADDGYLVVAPDLRSHGRSPSTDDHSVAAMAADVALLGDGYDVLVGHSLGGSIAAALLARPGFATAAVLVDPVLSLAADHREQVRRHLRDRVGDLDLDELRRDHPTWDERDLEHKRRAARSVTPTTVDAVFRDNDPWDVMDEVARWTARVHLLAADPALDAALRPHQLASVVDGDRVTGATLPGVGHSIQRERPSAVADAVRLVAEAADPAAIDAGGAA